MYNTQSIKQQYKTVFTTGNKNSDDVILILGSCRAVPYLNYLHTYNISIGDKYKIHCIDPINYHWDEYGNEIDYNQSLTNLESDENFLRVLKSTKIFIHEGLANHGILNTIKGKEKNIYQYGLEAKLDINIPNFHDVFILFNDFITIDKALKEIATDEVNTFGELTEETQRIIVEKGNENIKRFLNICSISDFPEMGEFFTNNFLNKRLFWTFNHVSKHFTREIFRLMNVKYFNFHLTESYWKLINEDMYETVFTPLCKYDLFHRTYQWNEETQRLMI